MEKQKQHPFEDALQKAHKELFPSFKTDNPYRELTKALTNGDIGTYIHLQVELEEILKSNCSWQF